VVALRVAIDALARDPQRRQAMGNAGRGVVEERYELGACTQRLRELYDELGHD
jgi:glycosyltransferase involved in cell wall biosynthesis